MVNRLWHHVFGRGLVATTDNFGRYGEAPTHPALLDYLASRFVEEGWSMKKLIRLMVLSDTFRQSSQAAGERGRSRPSKSAVASLPGSQAGRRKRCGTPSSPSRVRWIRSYSVESMQPYRGEAKPYRRLFQGPLDGEGRRSIYLKITRMEGPRFLETFDFPPPLQTRGNRDVTNVPSQVARPAQRSFCYRPGAIVGREDSSRSAMMRWMHACRACSSPRSAGLQLPKSSAACGRSRISGPGRHSVEASGILSSVLVWQDVAHTFFNMKEFLYLR